MGRPAFTGLLAILAALSISGCKTTPFPTPLEGVDIIPVACGSNITSPAGNTETTKTSGMFLSSTYLVDVLRWRIEND
jgi:hypothetical protein